MKTREVTASVLSTKPQESYTTLYAVYMTKKYAKIIEHEIIERTAKGTLDRKTHIWAALRHIAIYILFPRSMIVHVFPSVSIDGGASTGVSEWAS